MATGEMQLEIEIVDGDCRWRLEMEIGDGGKTK